MMLDRANKDLEKPSWLKKNLRNTPLLHNIKRDLREYSLHTVCESAKCPNICDCFTKKTATFMIMGDTCTRNCRFCAVSNGKPEPLDPNEPKNIAEMVERLGLKHVVITSVTRDDLPDGGASHFAATIKAVNDASRTIEVLTPDFQGNTAAVQTVLNAQPNVFNHNIETVRRLTSKIRSRAGYSRSLDILRYAKTNNVLLKSGIMVGLGESDTEIFQTLDDLKDVGCNLVTIGQYLRPRLSNLPVEKYVTPEKFDEYREYGESIGIDKVFSGPFVRSSYMAEDLLKTFQPPPPSLPPQGGGRLGKKLS